MVGLQPLICMSVGFALYVSRSPLKINGAPGGVQGGLTRMHLKTDITKLWVEIYQFVGAMGRVFYEFVNLGDTEGCLNDNLWCHRWCQGCRTGIGLFSVMVILNMFFLYVYFVFTCNKAFIYLYLYLAKPQLGIGHGNASVSVFSFYTLFLIKIISSQVDH